MISKEQFVETLNSIRVVERYQKEKLAALEKYNIHIEDTAFSLMCILVIEMLRNEVGDRDGYIPYYIDVMEYGDKSPIAEEDLEFGTEIIEVHTSAELYDYIIARGDSK